jgi:nucleotide-binding universal stress UspA family protein
MFRNLLVPVDLTDRPRPALKIATELAGMHGGQVTLLHVIELIEGASFDEEREFYLRLEQNAREHLDRLAELPDPQPCPIRCEVTYGRRAEGIVRYAAENEIDLIVLPSHRIDPDDPSGWGTLSYKVSIVAPCPVLLVK